MAGASEPNAECAIWEKPGAGGSGKTTKEII